MVAAAATPEQPPSKTLVFATVSFYMVAAIIMVTVNKYVMISSAVPIFLIFVQLVIAVILLGLSHMARIFVIPRWDAEKVQSLWKLIAVNVAGLSFNNYALHAVDASMYQVVRGLVLPLTVLLTFIMHASPPSRMCLVSCAIVTLGFFIGVGWDRVGGTGDGGVSAIGIFFGIISSLTTAVHAIIIKKSLAIVDGSAMDLAWYSNFLSALIMLPLSIIVGEGLEIAAMWRSPEQLSRFIWGGSVTGVFGFLLCLAGFLSIKVTSPVSHMVSGATRGVLQTMISVWSFGDVLTSGRALSIVTIIIGSCHYVWVKHVETTRPPTPAAAYEAVALEDVEEGKAGADAANQGSTEPKRGASPSGSGSDRERRD